MHANWWCLHAGGLTMCSSTLKIFFWYEDMSFVDLLRAAITACVFERAPTHADPCFTASIAYSTCAHRQVNGAPPITHTDDRRAMV